MQLAAAKTENELARFKNDLEIRGKEIDSLFKKEQLNVSDPTKYLNLQDKTFDQIREEILETRELIHKANEQDVEILGKMKEDLATGDDDLKMQLHDANIRIT